LQVYLYEPDGDPILHHQEVTDVIPEFDSFPLTLVPLEDLPGVDHATLDCAGEEEL
jgi:hypothetical protein